MFYGRYNNVGVFESFERCLNYTKYCEIICFGTTSSKNNFIRLRGKIASNDGPRVSKRAGILYPLLIKCRRIFKFSFQKWPHGNKHSFIEWRGGCVVKIYSFV